MSERVRSKYPSTLKYEYDLDIISKPASKFFGKVTPKREGGKIVYKLVLVPGISEALYKANLADEGSHKELKDGHFFTKTIDGLKFKYSIEPYGIRQYAKPNTIIIFFHPAETKVGGKKMYVGYKDDETDKIFRDIVKTVVKKDIEEIKNQAKSLKSLNVTARGIKEPVTAANKALSISNIKRKIGEYSIKVRPNNTNNFKKTLRNLHDRQKKLNEEYKKIANAIGK